MNGELLQLATQLAARETRLAAAEALARRFGAQELLIFIRDSEIDMLLTAPGMRQTLPDGSQWQTFLAQSIAEGLHCGEVRWVTGGELLPAIGAAATRDAAIVLVGTAEVNPELDSLRRLLPLLAIAIRGEQMADVARVHVSLADESAIRAAEFAQALNEARKRLHGANEVLRRQAHELESANESLQNQAVELEMQAVELETQIEARNAAHVQLEHERENAEKANRAKSEFLTTMSHELRTPLNAIGGYVQLIKLGVYGPITEEQNESLDRINRSQLHLLRLINEILSLARIEAGRVEYDIADVPIADAINELVPLIEPQLAAKNLSFEVKLPSAASGVRADREKLGQILINLLSNAIKFTDDGGTISISGGEAEDDPNMGFIRVSDTGRGIPEDKLDVIFDPFIQVETGLTRSAEGTGLGLSISRDLAHGMHGEIELESTVGKGSTFTVLLPRAGVFENLRI